MWSEQLIVARNDFTFVVQAQADLDGDGLLMGVEGYSESDRLYMSSGGAGTATSLSAGWE